MKKKILSIALSLALLFSLALTANAITYSDGTWSISHSSSSIYGEVKHPSCTSTLYASYTRSGVTSKCTSYYSENTSSGSVAYARADASYTTASGDSVSLFAGDHRTKGSTLSKSKSIPASSTVSVSYTVKGSSSVYYGISGTLAFK